jgi:HNH endonuclease
MFLAALSLISEGEEPGRRRDRVSWTILRGRLRRESRFYAKKCPLPREKIETAMFRLVSTVQRNASAGSRGLNPRRRESRLVAVESVIAHEPTHASVGGRARDVIAVWEASNYRCAVCNKDLSKKDGDLTLDHRQPLEFDGPNTPGNLRTACRSSNSKEYWRCWREYREKRAA